MDQDAKLIYLTIPTATANRTLSVSEVISHYSKAIEYDRGNINKQDEKFAYEMRDERKRRATFQNFQPWKYSNAVGWMLAKFGFFSRCDVLQAELVMCSFCKCKFKFIVGLEPPYSDDIVLMGINLLLRKHSILSHTCPRSLGLSGDNIKIPPICYSEPCLPDEIKHCSVDVVSSQEQDNTVDVDSSQEQDDTMDGDSSQEQDDTASDEYCDDELSLGLEELNEENPDPDPPYTTDIFSAILPVIGPLVHYRMPDELRGVTGKR